ncbi:hypothetical protein [Hymenobacter properus]|uniref:Phospholipase A(1) n=1 Tax=Hymenobacter properus TaxID=2791026 RepID=A0A931BCI2_9BACT|nr:hypothetical protein [Hymenobacter properus]MBF9141279.1 hypothetical protein [Hymenobacter properus]MBR7720089.1 hypothetical protein [Microvirga sp. SRT04]
MKHFYLLGMLLLLVSAARAQSATGGLPTGLQRGFGDEADSVARPQQKYELLLQSFEYNTVSFTKDSDDAAFMDFTVSQRYPLPLVEWLRLFAGQPWLLGRWWPNVRPRYEIDSACCRPAKPSRRKYYSAVRLNFAFSGRFGQYIGTRPSSPVIGKRFNPYLFLEYHFRHPSLVPRGASVRVGYGHESNGQGIADSAAFYATVANSHGTERDTRDYISRGWDYWGGDVSWNLYETPNRKHVVVADLAGRAYLRRGALQGEKEEYRRWEQPWAGSNLRRNEVSGLAASLEYVSECEFFNRVRLSAETGMTRPFRYNSWRALVCLRVGQLPVFASYADGYNGDLAQFGIRNQSVSAGLLLTSFGFPALPHRPTMR